MDLASENLNYSTFDIQYEFFTGDSGLYEFESKENDKHFREVDFSTTSFESNVTEEKQFRHSNFFETDVGSPLFNNFNENSNHSKVASTNRQYYAHRTSQFQPNRFDSDNSTTQSESSSPIHDSSSTSSSISRVFVCSYCNKSFTSEKYLSMHVSLHNVPNASVESNSVQLIVEEFKSQGICPIERTKAKGSSKAASWTCKICLKTFAQNSNYKNHIRTHSNERPFVCNICSIGFKERYHLKKHILFVHTSEMKEKCKICGKKFKDSTAVRAHERTHSDLRPYVCSRCNKAFKTSECLWHHENRSKACVKNYLKNNPGSDLKVVNRKNKFDRVERNKQSCQSLDKNSQETLRVENIENSREVKMEQHSNVFSNQNIASQSCPQYSVTNELVNPGDNSIYQNFGMNHIAACENNNLNCVQYDKTFVSDDTFNKQLSNSASMTTDRPYRCDECDTTFKLKVHLKKHNLYKHTDKYLCECRFCGKRFKDSSGVKLHERIHSDERPFHCQCGKTFKTRENLWGHQHRGPCGFSYETVDPNSTENWQASNNEYFGPNNTSIKTPLIPSQKVVVTSNSQEPETSNLARINSWKMVTEESKQMNGAIAPDQHPAIPTAIVVPMKRIPSNISCFSTQKVVSPNKKQVDVSFLPPFETFNDTLPNELIHHDVFESNREGNQFNSEVKFQQKLPDIQCMLQSFPQNYPFSPNFSSIDLIRPQNSVDSLGGYKRDFTNTCYQKQAGLASQSIYNSHSMEDFRYNSHFSISYNF